MRDFFGVPILPGHYVLYSGRDHRFKFARVHPTSTGKIWILADGIKVVRRKRQALRLRLRAEDCIRVMTRLVPPAVREVLG